MLDWIMIFIFKFTQQLEMATRLEEVILLSQKPPPPLPPWKKEKKKKPGQTQAVYVPEVFAFKEKAQPVIED